MFSEPVIEPKNLLFYGSIVIDSQFNSYRFTVQWLDGQLNRHKYIFYILLKLKKLINKNNKFYLNFNNIYFVC